MRIETSGIGTLEVLGFIFVGLSIIWVFLGIKPYRKAWSIRSSDLVNTQKP